MKRVNKCPSWDECWGCAISPMKNCNSCANADWHNVKTVKETKFKDGKQKNYKELLFQDLCARLPYKVKCNIDLSAYLDFNKEYSEKFNEAIKFIPNLFEEVNKKEYTLFGITGDRLIFTEFEDYEYGVPVEMVKPYLRPMSSMTEEEKKEYQYITERWMYDADYSIADSIDWLNEHHFDYRGLIPKGLAIAVTEENNPYK